MIVQKGDVYPITLKVLMLAGVSLGAIPAFAQTPPSAPSAAPAETAADDTNEIVVTAQKRSERLTDVPISISAVTADQLQKRSLTQVAQLSQSVPALRIDYAGNSIQPTIRGVGSQVAGPGFYSNIPIYVDGFYLPSPGSSDLNLINISSVNVLKGPQGTLFGFNATGGAIQVTTKDPQQDPTLIARASYARFNKVALAGYASTGIAPGLAIDIAGGYERGDGFVTNVVTNDDEAGKYHQWQVRTKILWEPSDAISFKLAYAHSYTDDPAANLTNARDGMTIGTIIPGNTIVTKRGQVANNAPNYIHLNTDSITLTSSFDLGFANLTSYTGFRSDKVSQGLEYDTTPANINAATWKIPDETFTQEFNLTSAGSGPFNWVLGAFYMDVKNNYFYNLSNSTSPDGSGAPFVPLFHTVNKNESIAIFADGTYEVADGLFLTAGGRYSWDNPQLKFNLFPAAFIDEGDVKFHNFSPRGVIRYELTPQSNVYASFTKGYKSGTLPGSSFSLVPVKPEKIDAWEVGYKISNRAIRFNIAAYYYDYKDIQVTAYGAAGASITRNAAAARIYGLDGDLTFQLTPDFDVTLSGAYTNAKFKSFPDAIGFQQDLNPANATYGQFLAINIPADDFPVQRSPKFAGSIGANYHVDVAGGKLALNGNLFYTSRFYFDSVKQLPQKEYALLNLRATWTDPSDHYDFSIFGTNVTSTKYRVQNFTDTFASRQVWGEPAVYGAQVTVRY
ncbi:TonB-dependent receptor [Sphingomonas sp. ID0503]|uniref:TonB-dependent receptor n=1 Tax=Sphingomonas sp. ID0503 TaxID=3399691 RepID=UPI003AFB3D95